jgi:hypothetical protein
MCACMCVPIILPVLSKCMFCQLVQFYKGRAIWDPPYPTGHTDFWNKGRSGKESAKLCNCPTSLCLRLGLETELQARAATAEQISQKWHQQQTCVISYRPEKHSPYGSTSPSFVSEKKVSNQGSVFAGYPHPPHHPCGLCPFPLVSRLLPCPH